MIHLLWFLLIPPLVFVGALIGERAADPLLARRNEWWAFPTFMAFFMALGGLGIAGVVGIIIMGLGI